MGRGTVLVAGALLAAGAAAAFLLLRDVSGVPAPTDARKVALPPAAGAGTGAKPTLPADAPPPAAPRTGDGVVTGVLLRSRTNLPLEGTVTATDRAGGVRTARSGPAGSFRVAGLARGEPLRVECAAPGLLPRVLPRLVVPAGNDFDLSYVFLGEGVRLEVLAMDGTGAPVAGCAVSVVDPSVDPDRDPWARPEPPEASETTDAAGRAAFAALPPGTWKVTAAAPGRALAIVSVDLAEGATRDPLRILLAAGLSLEGRVLADDGRPASGVAVSLSNTLSGTALSDASGSFRMDGIPTGSFTLFWRVHPGAWEGVRNVEIPAPGPVEIRLSARAEVRGRVVGDAGGAAVDGAEVQLDLAANGSAGESISFRASVPSGTDGAFRFPDVPALSLLSLSATRAGFLPFEQHAAQPSVAQPLAAGSVKEVEIRLKKGSVVRGVAREAGGKPISGAWVQLTVWRGRDGAMNPPEVHSDEEGRFVFPAVLPGRALLEAGARNRHLGGVPRNTWEALQNGELPESCGVVVPEQGEVVKDLLLVPDARVEGRILYRDGKPAPGFVPEVKDAEILGRGVPGTASAEDGSFVVEDLAAGTGMEVAVFGPWGRAGASEPFDIQESAVVKGVTVTVASPGTLAGRVRREDGKPAEGATLRLIPGPADPNRPFDAEQATGLGIAVPVATDGTFRVEALAPGRWVPDASAPGCLRRRGDPVEVGDGEKKTGVEVVLPPERFLSGRVLAFDGTPAGGARVWSLKPGENAVMTRSEMEGLEGAVLTDAEGRFRLGGLDEGTCEVHAAREDSVATEAKAEAGSSDLVLRLGQGFAIEGRVIEAGTGKPLEGIDVLVLSARPDAAPIPPEGGEADPSVPVGPAVDTSRPRIDPRQTAADGTFRMPGLAAGAYELQFSDAESSFVPKTVSGLRAGGKALLVELSRGLAIAGRVQDAGGVPLAPGRLGLAVESFSLPGSTSYFDVEEDGTFSVKGIPPGTYRLTVQSTNYGDPPDVYVPRTVEAEAGRIDLVIPLVRGKTISGRVRMADGSEPGEGGVELTLHPVRGADLPDNIVACLMEPDGSFTTVPLPDGVPFDLEAVSREGGKAADARDLLPGTTGVVLHMQAGGIIRGRVVDTDGRPVPGAVVWAVSARTDREFARAGATAEGGFALEGLPPGPYRLYASSQDANQAPVEPEGAVASGTTDAVVRTVKGLEFRARCVGGDGKPVGTANAVVERWSKGRWEDLGIFPITGGLLVVRGLLPWRIRFQVLRPGEGLDPGDPQRLAGPFEIPCPEQVVTIP